jgi:hypothetical protein
MKVKTLVEELGMTLITGDGEKEITGIYACDLLSWVISHAKTGDLWVTVMNNVNIVAVASLAEVACIVLAASRMVVPSGTCIFMPSIVILTIFIV